jgi:signal transduction histidine kinase
MKIRIFILLIGLFIGAGFTMISRRPPSEQPSADPKLMMCPAGVEEPGVGEEESLALQSAHFFTSILDTQSWPARWHCGTWSSFHGWLYIVSDIIIWISYFMIPTILAFFVYEKKTEPIPFRMIIILFISFILACGLTHLVDAAIFWWPVYKLSALIRLGTAIVSLGTVFALIQVTPKVLELKSPEMLERMVEDRTAALHELNARLRMEIKNREQVEAKLSEMNTQLEEKSQRLMRINEELLNRERDLLKSEEKVLELNADLENKVELRTRELDAMNKELEAFTYSVSHDLRAPLRSIHGYTTILSESHGPHLDGEGNRLLRIIAKNSHYMGQLIDDLLNFSRTSRTKLSKLPFNTHDHVQGIVNDLLLAEKERKIKIDLMPLEPCRGDITTLRQVWINLLSNAFKYTRKKDETWIEIGNILHKQEIWYYIKDNGVGFDMAYIDKLFGVFQRLHRHEEFEGTGVGLALVKRIIERHGGRIWAEGQVNEGAAFFFSLPNGTDVDDGPWA